MMRSLFVTAFIPRRPASLTIGAAVISLFLVISPGETIAIAAIVLVRAGDGLRRGRQQDGAGCDGDQELQCRLRLV
jgi:hypothetical protein